MKCPARETGASAEQFRIRVSTRNLFCLLALVAVSPYANTLFNEFVYDDRMQVLGNPYIQSFRYLREIVTSTVWSFTGAEGTSNYYRPMMTFGYLICYKLFGFAPYGFHLANVVLHTAVVFVLFLVVFRIFENRVLALVAAGLFALHPIHTESVAWVGAVTDLEVTFFYLLTFWLFLRVARPDGRRSESMQLAMVGSFALALLSKEQALTLPLLATVYEHLYRPDRAQTTRAQKFWRYGLLWLLAAAYVLVRLRSLGAFAPFSRFSGLNQYETVLSSVALVGRYLWKLLWPRHLCAYYVFYKSVSPFSLPVLAGVGTLILCAVLFEALWRRGRPASFGVIWLLATLAPVLNPHWVGANVFAERYLYLPSVGFCWVVAWGWVRLWNSSPNRLAPRRVALLGATGLVAALCMFRIVTRNREWRNDQILYARTLAASPDATGIRAGLAAVYAEQGNLERATQESREVLRQTPSDIKSLTNLGTVYIKEGRYAEAIDCLRRAVQLDPKYVGAHLDLGAAYVGMGSFEDAESQFRAVTTLAPLNAHAYSALGDLYWRVGDAARAESAFKRAISINSSDNLARLELGEFFAANGRTDEAVREYQAILRDDPGNLEALADLVKLTSTTSRAQPAKP